MGNWDVSLLKGAEVWVKFLGAGEQHGTIQSVKTPFASEDKEQAVNFSMFEVQLDSGQKLSPWGRTSPSFKEKITPKSTHDNVAC